MNNKRHSQFFLEGFFHALASILIGVLLAIITLLLLSPTDVQATSVMLQPYSQGTPLLTNTIYLPLVLREHTPTTTVSLLGLTYDGEALKIDCLDWSTCRNASSGTSAWSIYPNGTVQASYSSNYSVKRIFLYFDTSSIPINANMITATLSIYADQFQRGNKTIHVVPSTANTSLTAADFNKVQFVSGGSTTPSSPYTWMNIELNTIALDWITKSGITKLALIHDFDLNNTLPTEDNSISVGLAEDTQYRPYLVITYTTP